MSEGPFKVETMLQHLGEDEHIKGAVVPPIFQNSLFVFESCEEFAQSMQPVPPKHVYSRVGNPTVDIVNAKVAALEHHEAGMVFGSGMAAISTAIMSCVKTGAHVLAVDTCYGPTKQFLKDYLPRFGVTATFVEGVDPQQVIDAIQENTTLIYLESPSSIVFWMQDYEPICQEAHRRGIKVAMDSSYSAGILQNPTDFGVDLVLHSATKYLCGHSDVVAGALACSREHMDKIIVDELSLFGSILHPFPAWLMLRGLRTLAVRLKQHEQTGNEVAHWLLGHPKVGRVNHIGLDCHPQASLVKKYMRGSGGLLSFELKDCTKELAWQIVNRYQLFQRGVSWGGFESLGICAEYAPMNWEAPRWVFRLYCGLEDSGDLIRDLEQALSIA